MLLDKAADGLDHLRLGIAGAGLGSAAQAGAIAGLLGEFGPREIRHILASRAARRARRSAVHASARDGEDEGTVMSSVTIDDGFPAAIVNRVSGGRVACAAFGFARHCFCRFRVEYRIGCHNDESLGQVDAVDYPHLAVKRNVLT